MQIPNKFFKKLSAIFGIITGLFFPYYLKAQELSLGLEYAGSTGLASRDLRDIVVSGIQIVLGLIGLIMVVLIIYAGYLMIRSFGDEARIKKGKQILISSIVGLIIVFSAYAITTFVIGRLMDATGGGSGSGGSGSGGGVPTMLYSFQPNKIYPSGQLAIRNVTINVRFNKEIKAESVTNKAVSVKKYIGDNQYQDVPVSVTRIDNNRLVVKSTTLCPGSENVYCFDYDENNNENNKHLVSLAYNSADAVVDINGKPLTCSSEGKCQAEFIVGSEVDTRGPQANINQLRNTLEPFEVRTTNPNANVSYGGAFVVEAIARDSSGVADVYFYEKNESGYTLIGQDSPAELLDYFLAKSGPPGLWQTTEYQINNKYSLVAVASDNAGNVATSSEALITIKPRHCFNTELDGANDPDIGPAPDEPETNIDCGGICGACAGESCQSAGSNQCLANNSACSSLSCDTQSCLCNASPIINSISLDNGAVGNWITIVGKNFGEEIGTVMINEKVMPVLNQENCSQEKNWNNDYVIVVVPEISQGVKSVSLKTKKGLLSNVVEFTVNQTKRPGICSLDKEQYEVGQQFNVVGQQFGSTVDDRDVLLGKIDNGISAEEQNYQASLVTAKVPNVQPGRMGVSVKVNNEFSNTLPINVKQTTEEKLKIISFSPAKGSAGQYVTIIGDGFGAVKGDSQIIFSDNFQGEFNFPAQCGTDFWSNNRVIVKVPNISDETELSEVIKIKVGNKTAQSPEKFTFDKTLKVGPGLCSLNPRVGVVGSEFEVAGDNLQSTNLKFKSATQGISINNNNGGKYYVPDGAQTGEVVAVKVDDPSLVSNPLSFEVKKNQGQNTGGLSYYQWQFKTCSDCYRPKVVVNRQCLVGQIASPSPMDNSENNFVDSVLSVTFDRLMSQDSLNGDNVLKIEKCGNGLRPNSSCEIDNQIILSAVVNGSSINDNSDVLINKSKNFSGNTWYKITIAKTAKSVDGVSMEAPYSWVFKTRSENGNCSVDTLSCSPKSFIMPYSSSANVFAHAYNQATCNICPTVGGWNWSALNESVAIQSTNNSQASILAIEQNNDTGVKATNSFYSNITPGICKVKVIAPAPKLVVKESCESEVQSPSPFIDSGEICPNAMIAIRFNVAMKPETLTAEAISVKDDGKNINLEFHDFIKDEQGQEMGAIYKPSQTLVANKKYTVNLNVDLLQSKSGQYLDVSSITSWSFNTGSNDSCKIKDVYVNPGQRSLVVGDTEKYSALAVGQRCQLISTNNQGWQWRSVDNTVATINNNNSSFANAVAVGAGSTYIRARHSNIENKGNNGLLISSLSTSDNSFRLIKVEPVGENICTNALVRATFSRPVNPDSIRVSGKNDSIGLGKMVNNLLEPINLSYSLSPDKKSIIFETEQNFDSKQKYVAFVKGLDLGVTSFDGKKLLKTGCIDTNSSWNESTNSCEWSYLTSDEICQVNLIEINPKNATLVVDDLQYWQANAYSAQGVLLNNKSDWEVLDSSVLAIVNPQPQPTYGVTSTALLAGTTKIKASIGSVSQLAGVEVKNKDVGPVLSEVEPVSPPNACLNSLIRAKFDNSVNPVSLNNNASVIYQGSGCTTGSINQINLFGQQVTSFLMPKNEVNNLFYKLLSFSSRYLGGKILDGITGLIAQKVLADDPWCSVEGSWSVSGFENTEEIIFTQSKALPANAKIRVVFNSGDGGVVGVNGLPAKPLTGSNVIKNFSTDKFGWEFNTGGSICQVSYIDVYGDEKNNRKDWMFNRADNDGADDYPACTTGTCDSVSDSDKVFSAIAKTSDGKKVVPIEGVYSWMWSWRSQDATIAGVMPIEKPAGNVLSDKQLVVAENKNGDSLIMATAVFAPYVNQAPITGSAQATVFMCNNPWPTVAGKWQPINDSKYNFSFFYCRDSGSVGQQDDLPEIKFPGQDNPVNNPTKVTNNNNTVLPICSMSALEYCKGMGHIGVNNVVTQPNNGPCAVFTGNQAVWQYNNSGKIASSLNCLSSNIYNDYPVQNNGKNNLLRQYLLEVPDTGGDAIALRVYGNNYQNNVNDWYKFNVSNPGNPSQLTVSRSSYPVIQENRSAYMSFANQEAPISSPSVAKAFTMVLSYNQDANKNTLSISDQILKNIKFNTNINSDDQKQKLVRDFQRVGDLQSMARQLHEYFLSSGSMPSLPGGTFVPATSLSSWPSWQKTLASLLKTNLPVDPVNEFGSCGNCINPNKYNTSFEKPEDINSYQTTNAYLTRECKGGLPAPDGECLVRISSAGNTNNGEAKRTVDLSDKTTYRLTAKIFMSSSTPDVIVSLKNSNNSIVKEYTVSRSVTNEWKDVNFELTTNTAEAYTLNFVSSAPNNIFYIDNLKLDAVSGRCADFELSTCWNPKANNGAGEFSCSQNSYNYLYKYNKSEPTARLRGKLYALTELVNNWVNDNGGVNVNLDSKITLIAPTGNLPVCTSTSVGVSCGDGVVYSPELCEIGDSTPFCDAGKNWYNPASNLCESTGANACKGWQSPMTTSMCSGYSTAARCCGGYCGDGVLNKKPNYRINIDEQCDASVISGDKGYGAGNSSSNQYACSQSCRDVGGWCGDGVLQPQYGEQCDGNIGLSEWSCSDGSAPSCNGCKVKCNGTAVAYRGLCGNNVIENNEQCDYCGNGLQSTPGQGECSGTSVNAQYFCTPAGVGQCKWTGGYCGNGVVDVVNGQQMEYCDTNKPSTANTVACQGNCKQYQCKPDFYDCDAKSNNGCETNGLSGMWVEKGTYNPTSAPNLNAPTPNDINNKELISCGGCVGKGGVICAWVPNSAPMCGQGKCKLNCLNGYVDENGVYEDGCEKVGSSISGTVKNKNSLSPVDNAKIMLLKDNPNDKGLVATVESNNSGSFALSGLEKGRYKVIAYKKGFYSERNNINIVNNGTLTKDFLLSPGDQKIEGKVQKYENNSLTAYSSQAVQLWYQPEVDQDYQLYETVTSAGDGSYSFTGLERGGVFKTIVQANNPYYKNEVMIGALASSLSNQNIVMNRCGDGIVSAGNELCDGTSSAYSCSDIMTPVFSSITNRNWDGLLVCNASCQEFNFSGLEKSEVGQTPNYTFNYGQSQHSYVVDQEQLLGSDCAYGPPKSGGDNYRMIRSEDIWNFNGNTTIDNLVGKVCYFRADKAFASNPNSDTWRTGLPRPGYFASVFTLPADSKTNWYQGIIKKESSGADATFYCSSNSYGAGIKTSVNSNVCSWKQGGRLWGSRMCWIKL